jgi:large subunit ribosomal protein L9
MKVILLQELKGQGGEGDVVEVKRGYAVNYLLPNKIATQATKGNLKQLELRKHNIAKREAERLDTADKVLAALNEKTLVIPARVGEEGQLFGSVTTQQIAEKLQEAYGIDVDRRKIDQHAPIKTAGEHTVTVSIYRDVKAIVKIEVVDEKAGEPEAEVVAEVVAEVAVVDEPAADTEADAAVEEIVEQTNEALEEVANKLIEAADAAEEDEDVDAAAAAEAAAEVFKEAEAVIDQAAASAIEDAEAE